MADDRPIDSSDRAIEVFDTANGLFDAGAFQEAADLYAAVDHSGHLPNDRRSMLLYNAGVCYQHTGGIDAAASYWQALISEFPGDPMANMAQAMINDMNAVGNAQAGAADGMDDAAEAATTLKAAKTALESQDWSRAQELFQAVYTSSVASADAYGASAVGLARCAFELGDQQSARDYAEYAQTLTLSSEDREDLQRLVNRINAGIQMDNRSADGLQGREYVDQMMDAAYANFDSDPARAIQVYSELATAEYADGPSRGKAAFNVGNLSMRSNDLQTARGWYEYAMGFGYDSAECQKRIDLIDRADTELHALDSSAR